MSYLINSTRLASVIIGGSNVTDSVLDISLSDSSGIKNGLIATDGEISLGFKPGSQQTPDYRRSRYSRGEPITISVTYPSGNTRRHPRGSLYVIDSRFDPQDESIKISVGCKMALKALDGDTDDLARLVSLYMPSTRSDYQQISAALATECKIAWYDGYGSLQVADMWAGESGGYSPPGQWVSVFGLTTMAIAPLDTTRSINSSGKGGNPYSGGDPDSIELQYEYTAYPVDENGEQETDDPEDGPTKIDIQESESRYYVQYPAIYYERAKKEDTPEEEGGDLEGAGTPSEDQGLDQARPSDCVQEVVEDMNPASSSDSGGDGNGDTDCMDGYETVRRPLFVGVQSKTKSETYYEGPGGARDRTYTERYGPSIDANNQYYGDLYQLCRQSWATQCSPNGYCPTTAGTKMTLLGKTEFFVEFGPDGVIQKEITDDYETLLSAAIPSDWRASVVDGRIQGFRTITDKINVMYRSTRTEVIYDYPEIGTLRTTHRYTSTANQGNGMPGSAADADALKGIKTTQVERSYSLNVNPELPPSQTQPEPTTESDVTIIAFPRYDSFTGSFTKGLVFKESVPYPLLIRVGSAQGWQGYLRKYEDYIRRSIKGQSLGLRLGEALREEVASVWTPNLTFRYADPRYNTLISMRGDAHTWSLTPDQCVFTVDGLNVGFSNGTLNVPDNVVGAATAVL
jgi:hypothetical protein